MPPESEPFFEQPNALQHGLRPEQQAERGERTGDYGRFSPFQEGTPVQKATPIRELVQQGVIEKVVVPSSRKKSGTASVKCFRLVTSETKSDGIALEPEEDAVEGAGNMAVVGKSFRVLFPCDM